MNNKISDKDKKDWQSFIDSKQKVLDKDLSNKMPTPKNIEKTIDLHGNSLESANKIIKEFIEGCFNSGVDKINVITGKGSRSKNKQDPYQSETLGILKYSVPEYIKSNVELMNKIKEINFVDVNTPSKGNFEIFLKKFKN